MDEQRGPDLRKARDEVGWFYAASQSAMGLHAQSYADGGGGCIWDDERSRRMHLSHFSPAHRANVAKHARITELICQVPIPLRRDLELAYFPFGAGRLSGDRPNWIVWARFTICGTVNLLPIALTTNELRSAFLKSYPGKEPSFTQLLRYVAIEVARGTSDKDVRPGKALPKNHRLAPALRVAEKRELEAITAYEELRKARARAERLVSSAAAEASRAERERREWDRFERRTGISLESVA